ncbi:MAG: DsbA family protein [Anaerolineae bacterium]|nr:DsbA family protein [Anaerolineae bacterium]MDW8173484.1 thioredoxin domain-containing protein [Anaerolineae bacterium]
MRSVRLLVSVAFGLSLSSLALAQESTPAPDTVTTSIGTISLELPTNWVALPGRDGAIIVSNVDLRRVGNNYPPGTVIMQISNGPMNQLPAELRGDGSSAVAVLAAIAAQQNITTEVDEVTVGETTLASLDTSDERGDSAIYFLIYGEDKFAFVLTASFVKGDLAAETERLQAIIASIQSDIAAPIAEDALERYAEIEQGLTDEGFYRLGRADAPAQIIEISSFSCPACRVFHDSAFPQLLPLIAEGKVAFIYVSLYGIGSIPGGDLPARAAFCAGQQGRFWEYHDALFGWQEFGAFAFAPDRLIEGAKALELDVEAFQTCLVSDDAALSLEAARAYAADVPGFQGTPTILLNGRQVNWSPVPFFLEQVRAAAGD